MINRTVVCSSTPNPGASSRQAFSFLPGSKGVFVFAFASFCLLLSASMASAQVRSKQTQAKPEERARRVQDDEGKGKVSDQLYTPKEQVQPSQVRKTALTYAPRPGVSAPEAPALVNDLVIISRAEETSPARRLGLSKTGANIPGIWPVIGTLRSGVGMRSNPFGGSSTEYHKGQDISAPSGTPVLATADGNVVIAGWLRGYGQVVYIDHGNGITTRYGHLSRIDVTVGQTMKQGQQLGLVGSTGRSTGPHLHYEVRINGEPASPIRYLPALPPAQKGN